MFGARKKLVVVAGAVSSNRPLWSFQRGTRPRRTRSHQFAWLFALLCLLTLLMGACRTDNKTAAQRYLQSGLRYFERQKFEEASIQFRNALKRDPRAWEPHYYLGLSSAKLRRWQEAYRELNAAVELQPSFVPARLDLAELLLLGGNTKEARKQVDEAQTLDAKNVRAQALLGKLYLLEKDYPRAVEEFEKAKQLAPQDPALWAACGLAKVSAKQPELAEKDFRRALELDPDSAENYYNLANILRLIGRAREIEPVLRQAVDTHPKSLEISLTLADYYFREGRNNDIEELFARLKSRAAEFPDLLLQLGDFWMWRNVVDRAVQEFEAEQAKKPSLLVQKKLISAYLTFGRVADAERLNKPILKKDPHDLEGRTFDGALAYLRSDFLEASQKLQAVLKDDPKSLLANYYLGLSWMALNQPERAKAAFFDCVRANEKFVHAYVKLAELALRTKDWNVGSEYAKKILELDARFADGYLLLAQAYMIKGDLAGAESVLQFAKKLPSMPAEFNEVAAQLYTLKKDEVAATAQYEQALARTTQPFLTLTRYADFQVERGHASLAIDRVKQWLGRVPPQPGYYELLARLYLEQRDLENAEAAARKALEFDAQRWIAHFFLGEIYRHRGQPEKALAQYDETIRRSPSQTAPYMVAGNLLLEQGQYEKAKSYFDTALRQDPVSVQAQQAMARWYADRRENLDVALSIAQTLKKTLPEDPYVSDTLGWIYYQKGIYRLALEQLQPAARTLPDNAVVQFHLGMTYFQQGERIPARHRLERATKLGLRPPAIAAVAERTLNQLEGR